MCLPKHTATYTLENFVSYHRLQQQQPPSSMANNKVVHNHLTRLAGEHKQLPVDT